MDLQGSVDRYFIHLFVISDKFLFTSELILLLSFLF